MNSASTKRRDRTPSLLIRASIGVHVVAVLLLWHWDNWPVSMGLVIANHMLLTACGLWPKSTWLGANRTRLSADAAASRRVAVTIDDGPDPQVTPLVLDLLDQFECKATFFCIGKNAAEHASLIRDIVQRGHRIENHTQHHSNYFSALGPKRIARELSQAQETLYAITGRQPRYFRAPAGLRNPFLDPALAHQGLELVSWTRRGFDTVVADPVVVLARLTRKLEGGDILVLHDGHSARTASGSPVILSVLPNLLKAIADAGLETVTLDVGCK